MRKRFFAFFMAVMMIILVMPFSTKTYAYQNNTYFNNVRIGLQSVAGTNLKIVLQGEYSVNGQTFLSGSTHELSLSGDKIVLNNNTSYDELSFVPSMGSSTISIYIGGVYRKYQGIMKFTVSSGKILPINSLLIEDYLKGVVGYEMSDSYPIEALKAQAIAARNYTLANIGKHAGEGYDLDDTTHCQVYKGLNLSYKNVIRAVDETKGMVLLYNDTLVNAYFSASNGGYTEATENVWYASTAYIKSKPDTYSITSWPVSEGRITYTSSQIDEKLKANKIILPTDRFVKINIESIKRYQSGRVSSISIYYRASNGYDYLKTFTKEQARIFLSFPSSMYEVQYDNASDAYTFTGKGYGHGIGMSQIGARARAIAGQTFEQILTFYYENTRVVSLIPLANVDEIIVDKASPQPVNNRINITAIGSGSENILYKFWIHDGVGWNVVQDYSSSNTYSWVPTKPGNYRIWVDAKDKYSSRAADSCKEIYYTVNAVTINSITVDKASPQPSGTTINATANVSGSSNPLYKFWVHDGVGWKVIQDYSTQKTISWTPTKSGDYRIWVDVRDANSTREADACKEIYYSVRDLASSVNLTADRTSPITVNSKLNVIANLSGSSNPLYKFWVHDGTSWNIVQDYSSNNTYSWVPTKPGTYRIWVDAKDKYSSRDADSCKEIYYTVNAVTINSITVDKASPQPSGTTINATANVSGSSNSLYKFWVHDGVGWKVIQDYSTQKTISWAPTKSGDYRIWVDVRDANSTREADACKEINYSVRDLASSVNLIADRTSPITVNSKLNVIANASGSSNPLYKFWVHDGVDWKIVQDYSSNNTYSWVPTKPGNYRIWVDAKDKYSSRAADSCKEIYYTVNSVTINSITVDKASPQSSGTTINATANVSGSSNPLYKFWVHDGVSWKVIQDYSTQKTISWTPTKSGDYRIWVDVRDAKSTREADACKEIYYRVTN